MAGYFDSLQWVLGGRAGFQWIRSTLEIHLDEVSARDLHFRTSSWYFEHDGSLGQKSVSRIASGCNPVPVGKLVLCFRNPFPMVKLHGETPAIFLFWGFLLSSQMVQCLQNHMCRHPGLAGKLVLCFQNSSQKVDLHRGNSRHFLF